MYYVTVTVTVLQVVAPLPRRQERTVRPGPGQVTQATVTATRGAADYRDSGTVCPGPLSDSDSSRRPGLRGTSGG
jgi:hypothetical protein